jgi:hypothetical protein
MMTRCFTPDPKKLLSGRIFPAIAGPANMHAPSDTAAVQLSSIVESFIGTASITWESKVGGGCSPLTTLPLLNSVSANSLL